MNSVPLKGELFDEARRLMEAGEMPDKVSNKLLWAQNAQVCAFVMEVANMQGNLRRRIQYLETLGKLIGVALLGIALNLLFG